jgi:hypothetical protein
MPGGNAVRNALKVGALAVAIGGSWILAGCSSDNGPQVEVEAKVSVCVNEARDCKLLPLPDAEVKVLHGSTEIASGKTGADGKTTFTVKEGSGQLQVKILSDLIEDGEATAEANWPTAGGSTSVTIAKPVVKTVGSPA